MVICCLSVCFFGLCNQLDRLLGVDKEDEVIYHTKKWPLYSGELDYPVPHKSLCPQKAFDNLENLWEVDEQENEADKEYIRNRLALCLWLADEIEIGRLEL